MEGIERIKVLASEVKDEAVLEIVNYLISRSDMNEKYLNEEKSLKQMIDFIVGQAKKKAKNNEIEVIDNNKNAILKVTKNTVEFEIKYVDEENKLIALLLAIFSAVYI